LIFLSSFGMLIILPFGIICGHKLDFSRFGMLYQENSGSPDNKSGHLLCGQRSLYIIGNRHLIIVYLAQCIHLYIMLSLCVCECNIRAIKFSLFLGGERGEIVHMYVHNLYIQVLH
jgi:hypothetical protein